MRATTAAVIGGAVGSFTMLGLLMWWKKAKVLDPYVANVEAASSGSAVARNEMAVKAREVTQTLERMGHDYTEAIAQMTAEQYLADRYGLTPERIAGIKRLATVFGV